MKLQLRAYSLAGEPLDVLEEARNIAFSASALTFDMPKTAQGIDYFDGPIGVGVEIEALAGKTYGPLTYTALGEVDTRFLWRSSAQSLTQPTGIWSFTCPSIATAAFERMPIIQNLGDRVAYGPSDTPYTVIANRVAEAKARGIDYGITVIDGGGWTTTNVATNITFDNFATLDSFYTALKDTYAELLWVGTTLYVMAPGTMTIDRTGPVAFQIEDFSDIPQSIDRSNLADTVIGIGENGLNDFYPVEAPGQALAVQFSGVTDQATLHELIVTEWKTRQSPAREITASLALSSNGPDGDPLLVPYRDYHRGSLVTFPTKDGGTEPIKVADITLKRDVEEDFSGSVVLDTKLKPADLRIIELGKLGVGGVTTVSGNGSVLDVKRAVTSVAAVADLDGISGAFVDQIVYVTGEHRAYMYTGPLSKWVPVDNMAWDASAGAFLPRVIAGTVVFTASAGSPTTTVSLGRSVERADSYDFFLFNGDSGAQGSLMFMGHASPSGTISTLGMKYTGATAGSARVSWMAVHRG